MDRDTRALADEALTRNTLDFEDRSLVTTLRAYLEDLVGRQWIDEQCRLHEKWAADNSNRFLQVTHAHKALDTNHLVALIAATRAWEQDPENWLGGIPTAAKRLAIVAMNIALTELHAGLVFHERAEEHARSTLSKRLRQRDEVWAVFHECGTFGHFVWNGVHAEPRFLIDKNPVEMILEWNGQQIPLECKVKQPGTGRVISLDLFTTLAGEIAADLERQRRPGLFIVIGTTGEIRREDVEWIRSRVEWLGYRPTPLGAGELLAHNGRQFSITIKRLARTTSLEEVRATAHGFGLHNTFMVGIPDENGDQRITLVVGTEVRAEERPWLSLLHSLGDVAVKWRDATVPGLVSIHYADHLHDFQSLGPHHRYREAIEFWDRKYADALGVRLADHFPFSTFAHPYVPGMGTFLGEIITILPQIGAVLISSEPDLQVPGSGQPGVMYTVSAESRLPDGFPFGSELAVAQGSLR